MFDPIIGNLALSFLSAMKDAESPLSACRTYVSVILNRYDDVTFQRQVWWAGSTLHDFVETCHVVCTINSVGRPYSTYITEYPFTAPFQCWVRSDIPSSRCTFIIPVAVKLADNIGTGIQCTGNTFHAEQFPPAAGYIVSHACTRAIRAAILKEGCNSAHYGMYINGVRPPYVGAHAHTRMPRPTHVVRQVVAVTSTCVMILRKTSRCAAKAAISPGGGPWR
jgi:hypothetical protein